MEQSPAQKQLQLGEQKSEGNPENKGEELYQDMAYLSSADYFLKKDAKGELSMQDKEKLANSYRLNGMSEDAEYWYSQIINTISNPTNKMYYAEMLQSNGKCEDAARWFKIYQEESGDKTRTFIEDCDDAIPEFIKWSQ